MSNPFFGVVFHWIGGLAAGSFYIPFKGVRKWSWETYWLVGGFFSWIIAPWILALLMTQDLFGVLRQQTAGTLWWTYFFGVLWGVGGLTFGLSMRYLGMSLGYGVALGFCAVFGTLIPPLFLGQLAGIIRTRPGLLSLGGIAVCAVGIAVAALAGLTKEREMPEAQKKQTIAEFSFVKGILVATFAGIMSACMAFALSAGNPIAAASKAAGTPALWTGLPKLVVILLGGFTTNLIWCIVLGIRNRTAYQYIAARLRPEHAAPGEAGGDLRIPWLGNLLFAALAGVTWYLQFFFYSMGETQMGKFGFASWTLHMASIIIFSTAWGWIFHEWKGASKRAHTQIASGIALLILSTLIIGAATWWKGRGGAGQ